MIQNRLKQIWQDGQPVMNGWLTIGNSFVAEIMAAQGYDSVSIDIQHGALDYADALGMFQAMRASGVVPMARVPWNEPGAIMKALDAGALGIICPMVNSVEEAQRFADCLRYPPVGARSYGPTRAMFAQGGRISEEANDQIVGFAMIETRQALERAAEIAAVPGIDGLYIGPADLTLSLRGTEIRTGFDREEPDMIDAIKSILAAAKSAGKRAALHCGTADYAARAIGWGFDMVTVSGDARILAAGAGESVARFRELTGGTGEAGKETGGY